MEDNTSKLRLLFASRFNPYKNDKGFKEWLHSEVKHWPYTFSFLMHIYQYTIFKVVGEKSDSIEVHLIFEEEKTIEEFHDGEVDYYLTTLQFYIPDILPSYWKDAHHRIEIGTINKERLEEDKKHIEEMEQFTDKVLSEHYLLQKRLKEALNLNKIDMLSKRSGVSKKKIESYAKWGFKKQIKEFKSKKYQFGEGKEEEDDKFLVEYLTLHHYLVYNP